MAKSKVAYAAYVSYCENANVKPYSYRYWLKEVYLGNEDDPACNWN